MVFSSLVFLLAFLPITLMLYFISKNKTYRNCVLLLASLFFYAWGEPIWVFLMIFTVFIDYTNGKIVERYRGQWQSKSAFIASIVFNISILCFFKYSSFLTININDLLGINLPYWESKLPIGISFYTFQSLSYVIDVYRGDVKAQRVLYKYMLFVSCFHQLVAGPIVRYIDIAKEIDNRVITKNNFSNGLNRLVLGLGKKVIIANTVGEIADKILSSDIGNLSFVGSWLGITMYSIQIYFDFSGYSDMAIGLGKMFGFTYKENFNYPYIAKSATDFWRRWHISLGTFFRDYVYIPLGGNRKHQLRNIIIVWALTGLWHGANWNFLAWGLYYGMLILLEKKFLLNIFEKLPRIFSHIYLIVVAIVGWTFFYFEDMTHTFELLKVMFGFTDNVFMDVTTEMTIVTNIFIIVIAIIACTPLYRNIYSLANRTFSKNRVTKFSFNELLVPLFNFSILAISLILVVGQSYNPFLYFRF